MCNDNTEGMEHRYHVWLKNPSSRAYPLMQLPASNTGTNDPNLGTIKYPISFTQDMQMFKNGGNETFTFLAQYESSIDVKDGIQTGVVDGSSGVKWSIRIDKTFSELEEVAFNVKITEHNASFYTDCIQKMGAVVSRCFRPEPALASTPILHPPEAKALTEATEIVINPGNPICPNQTDLTNPVPLPADLWQWHDSEDELGVDPNELYKPKLIFSCSFDDLTGKRLDMTPYATPRRIRLISLTSLTYRNRFEVYEFETLPMYTEIMHRELKALFESGPVKFEKSHCHAVSFVWRGLSADSNPETTSTASRRATSRGTFTVEGVNDGDPISLSVLDDIRWCASHNTPTFLWLDQICIMQTSDEDKAFQIQGMNHIYATSDVIVLPGGLGRLATVDDGTTYMDRAWTFQEAIAGAGSCFLFSKENMSSEDYEDIKQANGFREHDEPTSLVVTAGLFDVLEQFQARQRNPFGFHDIQVSAFLEAHKKTYEGLGIWQCSYMRTCSRSADAIYSIMDLFGVSLDPRKLRPDDRVGATLALAKEILAKPGGKPAWLSGLWFLPPSKEHSAFPQFPETSTSGKAYMRMSDGSLKDVVSLMDRKDFLTTYAYFGESEFDEMGYLTFSEEVCSLKSAESLDASAGAVVPWYINRDVRLESGDGQSWHPISRDGRPEKVDYPDYDADALALWKALTGGAGAIVMR
ncbi:hypothetical protein ONZ45_g9867 [Pleurotus djamor]|nr:hypothetical protein ONZ45_g9867 [Pleurotus djamor]